ncbi:UDP-N-acetylglucosamine 2-epimerase (non-hydrolyzing) [Enterococcus hulanensis]|uniref:UDP-N-acetylglucosamine 2-epimerase (non-hydrolyzing) n=1 Tax=Enterococcus hulanensis TaxID=2559929 RepID=A0ABU3F3H9_9ENTE|nr:UDP-N-acetylglucosamine 2-epimerase (non-hydrolyzing) [Enterococcus hulanensis]MDT2601689.1 UDP-N-acetylglucosamine 2-epimerase (non-hydrolyzing) [Enterococcus hulanensis]MDT2609169.1 UDP-N-acetylglucosamine 2-epimerase (non-hydrolyzing) [Enterococcus hulanensis]MDT2616790.1 UDP-N-acetylglucosamine 2-epimerase (non-hydrolyzing) [Enterococcus hulanensis]MDT2629499.1 UDP-N-acetylglucosamine 2-epimerase (non-hydrolyzing) [Enterococcus hulanensis]MDT2657186.1 UDP-N-acetylglucosamine 2-epimerase
MRKKVFLVFGTRPEAIKMAPLAKKLAADDRFESKVVVTGQHREMLDQVLQAFSIVPDYDLNIMHQGQTLSEITSRVLEKLTVILLKDRPDILLVHGDTTTTFSAALAAFYQQIPIGHVEAGLRTWDKYSPFPEEMNRQLTDDLTDLYFAPTMKSKENLVKESHSEKYLYVTGNTAIDAMVNTIDKNYTIPSAVSKDRKRIVLITMHRRENLGEPMQAVFNAIKKAAIAYPDTQFIFPMHKNPAVRKIAQETLGSLENISLIEPLDVIDFHNYAKQSYLILTDSGGVQEEAPSLGVPVLVLRDQTERPEGVAAGTLRLVGTDSETVYATIKELFEDSAAYEKMAKASNPYGDGKASERITEAIAHYFQLAERPKDFSL